MNIVITYIGLWSHKYRIVWLWTPARISSVAVGYIQTYRWRSPPHPPASPKLYRAVWVFHNFALQDSILSEQRGRSRLGEHPPADLSLSSAFSICYWRRRLSSSRDEAGPAHEVSFPIIIPYSVSERSRYLAIHLALGHAHRSMYKPLLNAKYCIFT